MPEAVNLQILNHKDQELFYKKICELHTKGKISDCFKQIDIGKESYYEERKSPYEGIKEYSISTIPELRKELQMLWNDSELKELIPMVIASTFKAKAQMAVEVQKVEKQYEGELPQYIYNF